MKKIFNHNVGAGMEQDIWSKKDFFSFSNTS